VRSRMTLGTSATVAIVSQTDISRRAEFLGFSACCAGIRWGGWGLKDSSCIDRMLRRWKEILCSKHGTNLDLPFWSIVFGLEVWVYRKSTAERWEAVKWGSLQDDVMVVDSHMQIQEQDPLLQPSRIQNGGHAH
jgi:hypothetical protein